MRFKELYHMFLSWEAGTELVVRDRFGNEAKVTCLDLLTNPTINRCRVLYFDEELVIVSCRVK